jgi:hypothetical protein
MNEQSAVLLALHVYGQPALAKKALRSKLPTDFLYVIKIAADDSETIDQWVTAADNDLKKLREACLFFLQANMLSSPDDDYRILGLTASASAADVRIHKRWLLKWLHPDKNQNSWEAKLFHRVVSSASSLEGKLVAPAQGPMVVEASSRRTQRHETKRRRSGNLSWKLAKANNAELTQRRMRKIALAFAFLGGVCLVGAALIDTQVFGR